MRPLIARHLDRVADFDHVEPVGVERVGGEAREIGRARPRFDAAHGPAERAAGKECRDDRRSGGRHRTVTAPCQPVDVEPLRRHFVGNGAITRTDELGLLAPSGDPGGIVGMRRKPRFDGHAAVGGQFAVDIGVEFIFADNLVSIDHSSLSLFTSRGATPDVRRRDTLLFDCARAPAAT